MTGEDHFADFDEDATSQPISAASAPAPTRSPQGGGSYGGGGNRFANEIFTEKISAKMRTFFIDVKESSNGKFVKISEKSRGGQKIYHYDGCRRCSGFY
jgi:hypothetical protein